MYIVKPLWCRWKQATTCICLITLVTYNVIQQSVLLNSISKTEESMNRNFKEEASNKADTAIDGEQPKSESTMNTSISMKKKPLIVIHGGPPKTGTTYLQSMLSMSPNLPAIKMLEKDNYSYLGKCFSVERTITFENCFHPQTTLSDDPIHYMNSLKDPLEKMEQEWKNGLIIAEGIINDLDMMLPHLNSFDVQFVVTYRRLFEHLPSDYCQHMKILFNDPEWDANMKSGPVPFDYFDEEDLHTLALQNWARGFQALAYGNGLHDSQKHLKRAEDLNVTSVAMMDTHAKHENSTGNDLTVELFCSGVVPGLEHTCAAAKENKLDPELVEGNKGVKIDIFMLAYQAYKRGIIKSKPDMKIVKIIEWSRESWSVTSKQYKQTCMSDEKLEKLHGLSWKHEHQLYPDRKEDDHRAAFEKFKAKGKFCTLDIDAFFEEEDSAKKFTSWAQKQFNTQVTSTA
jgi:hypothetical protein